MADLWQNIYLFYGEDIDALTSKVEQWVSRFAAKSDALLDKEELDASNVSVEQIEAALRLMPLLGPKRLVIIRNVFRVPSLEQQRLVNILSGISGDCIVLLIHEGALPAKSTLASEASEHTNVSYFAPPSPQAVQRRIETFAKEHDKTITGAAIESLLKRVQGDTVRLKSELEKLVLAAIEGTIDINLIEELVREPLESRIFVLTDAIFARETGKASRLMIDELEFGTAPLQLLGLLISQTRRLLAARDALDRGLVVSSLAFFKTLKPFVISTIQKQAARYTMTDLISYYARLCLADIVLKQGIEPLPVMFGVLEVKQKSSV